MDNTGRGPLASSAMTTTWILMLTLAGVVVWKFAIAGGVGAKRLECPSCDLYILGARPHVGGSVVCPHCRAVGVFRTGRLEMPAADLLAAAPTFCAELPQDNLRWPSTCCACAEPPTRGVTIQIRWEQDSSFVRDLATRTATLGMFRAVDQHTVSLDVPHCAQHADGAALVLPYERAQANFGIAFRSFAYFTQFLQLNGATARRATMFGGQPEDSDA